MYSRNNLEINIVTTLAPRKKKTDVTEVDEKREFQILRTGMRGKFSFDHWNDNDNQQTKKPSKKEN